VIGREVEMKEEGKEQMVAVMRRRMIMKIHYDLARFWYYVAFL
jgi:hypothetical protein